MQTAGGGFAAAITAQDQLIDYKLTISLPAAVPSYYGDLTKCVVSVDIQRAITTTLPDGTTLISGYPTAAATIVLAGMLNQAAGVPLKEADSAYRLFNPNDPSSVMYRISGAGLPIAWEAGLWDGATSADLVTQYTGTVDQVTCSNGVVTLVCRDQRSTVTNQATLPPVVTFPPYNAGLTSEFAIDYLLRHSSPAQYLSWPQQRPNCAFAAGMRSSIWPEVGSYASFSQIPTFDTGLYGTALTSTGGISLVYQLATQILPSQSFFMEAFVSAGTEFWVDTNMPGGAAKQHLDILYSGTSVTVFTSTASGTSGGQSFTVTGTGIHYVGVQVNWTQGSTTVTGTLYFDGASHSFSFTAADARTGDNMYFANASVDPTVADSSMEGFQVSVESAGVSNGSFAPTLFLDDSLNPLTALPDVSGKDAWTVLQDIAAAESAVVGFDELGICRFVNRETIATSSSVRTITSSQSLVTLDSLQQMSLCATHVQVPVNQIQISAPQTIWGATTVLALTGYQFVQFKVTTDTPVLNIATSDTGYWLDPGAVAGETHWRACTTADGSGTPITSGVFVSVEQESGSVLLINVYNGNPFSVYLSNPGLAPSPIGGWTVGAATLWVGGQLVTSMSATPDGSVSGSGSVIADSQWPPIGSGGAVANPTFGEVLLALPANDWVQDLPSAQALADHLISDLHYPTPLYRNVTIVADPRLQLMDRVTLVDPDVSQINDDALIMGIESQLSAGQWTQTIDARALYPPGAWLLGVTGSSELGITTYLF